MALSHAGASLETWLNANGPLAGEMVKACALQLEAAIRTLHCHANLLHLDIKPGNILWCSELSQLQLCDLGLGEPYNGAGVAQPRFTEYVTLPYRPPELWHLAGDVCSLQSALGPAIDLWGFGCVLFEACSGMKLMKPFDSRQRTSKQAIANWCANWSETSSSFNSRRVRNASNPWLARIKRCSSWGRVVLSACHPEPKARKWMNLGKHDQQPK